METTSSTKRSPRARLRSSPTRPAKNPATELPGRECHMDDASSHAVEQQWVYGIALPVAVFTNSARDHLEYHGTMKRYSGSKRVLVEGGGTEAPRAAGINIDDDYGRKLEKVSRKRSSKTLTYG